MYKSKTFYPNNRNTIISKPNEQQFTNSFHRILETIINKDQENFNKEINTLNKIKIYQKNNNITPLIKIFEIIKSNLNELNIENIEKSLTNDVVNNNNTDLKLEYLQYMITFDINESNGEFLEDKLEIAREILKNNNYKLKY